MTSQKWSKSKLGTGPCHGRDPGRERVPYLDFDHSNRKRKEHVTGPCHGRDLGRERVPYLDFNHFEKNTKRARKEHENCTQTV